MSELVTAGELLDIIRYQGIRTGLGELEWDMGERVLTVNAPRSKAVIGSLRRGRFDLGGVQITAGATRQDWAVIQLTVLDGVDVATATRLLISAAAYVENSGIKGKSIREEHGGPRFGERGVGGRRRCREDHAGDQEYVGLGARRARTTPC